MFCHNQLRAQIFIELVITWICEFWGFQVALFWIVFSSSDVMVYQSYRNPTTSVDDVKTQIQQNRT
jgi:hypothetical protein